MMQPLSKTVQRLLKKSKNGTALRFSNLASGYTSKRTENMILKRYLHMHVHCSIIYDSHVYKYHPCLLKDKWIKKMCVCTQRHIEEEAAHVNAKTLMKLEGVMVSEMSQSQNTDTI